HPQTDDREHACRVVKVQVTQEYSAQRAHAEICSSELRHRAVTGIDEIRLSTNEQRVRRLCAVGFAIGPAGRSENDELAARLRSRSSDAGSALTWIPRRETNQRKGHDQSTPHSFHLCSSPKNGFIRIPLVVMI